MPKGKGYSNPVGMYSHKSNPLPAPKKVAVGVGMSSNPDKAKVDRLAKEAYAKHESLRGKAGM